MNRAIFFFELQKMMWDYNIMKVSKVQNLLIRLCAQFNTALVPTNTIRIWVSMKGNWNWVQTGFRLLRAWHHHSPPGICMKNEAKPQLVEGYVSGM